MKQILVLGSINYDVIFRDGALFGQPGGGCLNVAMNLKYLGADFVFQSFIGRDRLGDLTRRFLSSRNINCVLKECEATNLAVGFSDDWTTTYDFFKILYVFQPAVCAAAIIYASGSTFLLSQNVDAILATGAHFVYDFNVRAPLNAVYYANLRRLIDRAAVIKYSDEDLRLCGIYIKHRAHICTFRDGCDVFFNNECRTVRCAVDYAPVSVVGAGDAFSAMLLWELSVCGVEALSADVLYGIARRSCCFAARKVALRSNWVE